MILAACGSSTPEPEAEGPDDVADPADPADPEDPADDPADGPGGEVDPDVSTDDDQADDTPLGPQADPDRVADPCEEHEGREMDAFIDLVAPVQDQQVSGSVEIVGCANVFEATVAWMLLDGDGRTLDEGFTTATCGSGCVGEFRDTVPLDEAAGEPVAYLQVYSENMADEGPDQLELTEVMLLLD